MRMNVVKEEYEKLAQMFHLIMWLFQSVSDILFRWNGLQWWNVALLLWNGIWA